MLTGAASAGCVYTAWLVLFGPAMSLFAHVCVRLPCCVTPCPYQWHQHTHTHTHSGMWVVRKACVSLDLGLGFRWISERTHSTTNWPQHKSPPGTAQGPVLSAHSLPCLWMVGTSIRFVRWSIYPHKLRSSRFNHKTICNISLGQGLSALSLFSDLFVNSLIL